MKSVAANLGGCPLRGPWRCSPKSAWLVVALAASVSGSAFAAEQNGKSEEKNEAPAQTQSLIKSPTLHPSYSVELEPHVALYFVGDDALGIGARATFKIVDPGFIPNLNNSVGIGVGIDWLRGSFVCDVPSVCHDYEYDQVYVPIVLQWNFWFTRQWSAFGEPGLALRARHRDHENNALVPVFGVGGRFNFNDKLGLTLRLGAPDLDTTEASLGVSFFL